jgi:16S rRNA processing protein RimM
MESGRKRQADPDPPADFLEAGTVVATHGVAGGIKVKALSGDPSGLLKARRVRLVMKPAGAGPGGREHHVQAARRSGGCAVLSLKGIDSLEAAQELIGAGVLVSRCDLPPPEEDEFFVADLVGCSVESADGSGIGAVAGVIGGPAHDWLAIRRKGKREEALLPLVSRFVREVDTCARRIVVTPPEGWTDEG